VHDNGAERPAMQWLQRYVRDNIPTVDAAQVFAVSESAGGGTPLGAVRASDADADAVLTDWRIDGGDGAALFTIDPAGGGLSVGNAATLDFETATSYILLVSVYDGFRRSPSAAVRIDVRNENDNAPAIATGQQLRIDGGVRNAIGRVSAVDNDDRNEPGFTTLQDWSIVGGNPAAAFAIHASNGDLRVARTGAIDFRRSSYSLLITVGDGSNTAAAQSATVTIPDRLNICLWLIDLRVPKLSAPPLLRLGATLGRCRAG
jgi:hypothetical protein